MKRILEILKEPTSYAGLAAIALSLGLSSEEYQAISALVAALAGAVLIWHKE